MRVDGSCSSMDCGRAYKSRRNEKQQPNSKVRGTCVVVWDDRFESDFFVCLDKNEKIFQARMRQILEKYNKPFEEDVLVDIKSLAYITPNKLLSQNFDSKASCTQRTHPGRKEQKSKAAVSVCSETFLYDGVYHADGNNDSQLEKESDDTVCNETFIISEGNASGCHLEDPCNSQLVEFKGSSPLKHLSEMRHGKTYAANVDIIVQTNETSIPKAFAVQCTEENSFSYKVSPLKYGRKTFDHGHTADISLQYLSARTAHCNASPIKVSISSHLKSFFGRHHRDVSTVAGHQTLKLLKNEPDEYNFGDDEDSDSPDPLDVSLADYYPSMIVCLSRLMEIPCKQQAAANIIKHYRRRLWCSSKNRPDMKKAKKQICKSANTKLVSSSKPKSVKTSNTFLTETDKIITCRHKDFEESGIIEYKERRRPFHSMSSHKATLPVAEQMSFLTNTVLLPKEKPLPDKFFIPHFKNASLPPKYEVPNCVHGDTKLLSKLTSNQLAVALLNQKQLKYDAFVPKDSPNKFQIKAPQRSVPSLRRRHSFSTLPDKSQSTYDGAFETLYKKLLSEGSHQRSLPPNTQYPLSDTVNALINSPILNKGKRPASEDLPFSKFKRHRSATETFVLDTSNPKTNALPSQMKIGGSDLWHGSSSQRWNPKEHPSQPVLSLFRSPRSSGSLSTWLYSRSPKSVETFSLPSTTVKRASSRKLNYN
ncbi:uncharacterized protein LOC100486773 isoform X1 [Xenopus tropicalis]|uniref:Uncharacterized protein LOC100486773 isoform X1 n=1 Tax=Xenopus tropicalis TaxID=8364 RepID=A0A8J1J843_XENTR|nr:uncharacterized protein LOC100486773 isoform X1 [Xenopus tropicalis]